MNRSFQKLLQLFAGVALLSMASLSMAATYDYDFDADENERGGQPLNFGDLNVYGYKDGQEANAYLDSGNLAGLGVCGTLFDEQQGTNWCNPGSDDNLQVNEVFKFVFDVSKKVSVVGINGPHDRLMVSGFVSGQILRAGICFRLPQIKSLWVST